MTRSPCVILESPYGSDDDEIVKRNVRFALNCASDCLSRGEAVFASHLFYTRLLDDRVPAQRELGIECGLAWLSVCDYVVVYTDLGITPGMQRGMDRATACGKAVVMRNLAKSNADAARTAADNGIQ